MEFGAGEEAVEGVEDDWSCGADEEGVGERGEDLLTEEAGWADEDVLDSRAKGGGDGLAGPDVSRVCEGAIEVLSFGCENPSHGAVVDRHADNSSEDLADEDCSRWDVHVVADLLVLHHVLGSVPCVACD